MSPLPHDVVRIGADPDVELRRRRIVVDGIGTRYCEAGDGPVVVLLHSGEYGACAEHSFEYNIAALASRYRVIAPDWLGFGGTDKLHDFGGGGQRRIWHMSRFLEVMAIDRAAFIGNSMGATILISIAAAGRPPWPIAAAVLASGGGFIPDNAARRQTLDYDGTQQAMRAIVRVFFHDPAWSEDDGFVRRRWEASIAPGAWEAVSAARFRSPVAPPRSEFGRADETAYERVSVPVLLVAGADDPLREPGYAAALAARIPHAQLAVFDGCSHMPQIEHAPAFNERTLRFLAENYGAV